MHSASAEYLYRKRTVHGLNLEVCVLSAFDMHTAQRQMDAKPPAQQREGSANRTLFYIINEIYP